MLSLKRSSSSGTKLPMALAFVGPEMAFLPEVSFSFSFDLVGEELARVGDL